MFGYTSIDQILAPFYLLPYLWLVDTVPLFRRTVVSKDDQKSSFCQSFTNVFQRFRENRFRAFFTVFAYRFLINARAMVYFYMGVTYDLETVYLELTLVRIILSWIFAFFVCLIAPNFISLTAAERNTVFAPQNLILKGFGTVFILVALVVLNESSSS